MEPYDSESIDGSHSGVKEQSKIPCLLQENFVILNQATHVPDQTPTILSSRTLPRCDSGLPRNTQKCPSIMGDVFGRPPAQEGLSSTIFNNSLRGWDLILSIQQDKVMEWEEIRWIHRLKHLTSKAEVECYPILRELVLIQQFLVPFVRFPLVTSSLTCPVSRTSASLMSLCRSRVNSCASAHWSGMSGCVAHLTQAPASSTQPMDLSAYGTQELDSFQKGESSTKGKGKEKDKGKPKDNVPTTVTFFHRAVSRVDQDEHSGRAGGAGRLTTSLPVIENFGFVGKHVKWWSHGFFDRFFRDEIDLGSTTQKTSCQIWSKSESSSKVWREVVLSRSARTRTEGNNTARKGRTYFTTWRSTKANKKHKPVKNTQSGWIRVGISVRVGLMQTCGWATGTHICRMILRGNRRRDNCHASGPRTVLSNAGNISMLDCLTMCELSVGDEEQQSEQIDGDKHVRWWEREHWELGSERDDGLSQMLEQ